MTKPRTRASPFVEAECYRPAAMRASSRNRFEGNTILQVLPALGEGGVERGTIEMVEAIVAAGGRALVASAGGRLSYAVERAGGVDLRLPLMTKDPLNILLNARRLARLIRRHGVDLVHARSRAPAWSARIAARRTGVAFVTTWHGVYSENVPFKRRYNAVMASGDRVIAISDFVAARVARDHRVGPDRLRVIHRGAELAQFDPSRITGERLHRLAAAWRVPDGARIVLMPGRLTAWKGQSLLLEALSLASDPSLFVVFVGATGGRESQVRGLCDQAARLGLAERLRFAGHCDDMAAAYQLADFVVAPSLRPEPFGRVVVEAQAMGRLVIVADHGGAAETVSHNETGWRVPPGDAASLAAALDAATALTGDELERFGTLARASVEARFSTTRMQAATLAVYAELLGRPGGVDVVVDEAARSDAARPPAQPVAAACGSW